VDGLTGVTSHKSCQFTPHHYTSLHSFTFCTLFLKVFSLQGKDAGQPALRHLLYSKSGGTVCKLSQFHSSMCSGYCPPLFLSCWFGYQHPLWPNSIEAYSLPVSLHPVLLLKVSAALNPNWGFCNAWCFIQYPCEPSYSGCDTSYVYQDCWRHNPCAYKTFVFPFVKYRCEMWYVKFDVILTMHRR